MFAVQRQEDIRVDPAEALHVDQLSADGDLSAQQRELGILPGDRRGDPHRMAQQHRHRLRPLAGDHRDRVDRRIAARPADDPGLLRGDLADGGTQVLGVIHSDRRDHHHRAVDDAGRIPGPAHPGLDDGDVDRGVGERGESHRGEDFELAHRRSALSHRLRVDQLHERLDLAVGLHIAGWTDRPVVDGDSLDHRLQVRAGGAPGALTERAQQGVDHAGHRRLAVGSGDMDARVVVLRRAEQFHQRLNPRGAGFELGLRPPPIEQVLHLEQRGDLVEGRLAHAIPAKRAVIRSTSSRASFCRSRILSTMSPGALARKASLPSLAVVPASSF